jgi:hypothetical protein
MRTRGNSGIIGQTVKPGTGGVTGATDAAQASAGGSWPGSVSTNIIFAGGASSGYAVTTTVTSIMVTDSGFANTPSAIIGYSNSFIKVFGAGFIANTAVVVNANTVPRANVTYVSQSELRVVLPMIANVATVTINVLNTSDNNNITNQVSYSGNYLVVGGGGGGGYDSGAGGGGGGLVTANLNFVKGISYPIVVGSGGFGTRGRATLACEAATDKYGRGLTGNSSIFFGSTAQGGGGGGARVIACAVSPFNNIGRTGGSGGGGGGNTCTPSTSVGLGGGLAIGSPGQGIAGTQGYPGGLGFYQVSPNIQLAGGGGGYANTGGTASSTCGTAGNGGLGYTYPFTGLGYAGGGGGGRRCNPASSGQSRGGAGGSRATAGIAGQCGSGSGGGGGGSGQCCGNRRFGGNGGPGAVIIVVPNAAYPTVTATGATASTPACAPGMTVLTWNGPAAGGATANASYTFIA